MSEPRSTRGRRTIAPRGPGRRTVEQRNALAADEASRTSAREAEYTAEVTAARLAAEKAARAKQRAAQASNRRGRGGYMGDARSGPLSSGIAFKASGIPRGSRTGGAREFGVDRVKREGDDAGSGSGSAGGDTRTRASGGAGSGGNAAGASRIRYDHISDDDDYESDGSGGPRVDVDFINLISDEEGSDTSQPPRAKFVPVRVDRIAHRDRAPQINPDASSTTIKKQEDDSTQISDIPMSTNQRGKQRARDVEIIETARPWKGAYEDENTFRYIKEEEGSPVPVSQLLEPEAPAENTQSQTIEPEEVKPFTKKKVVKIPEFETEEDEKEWIRHNEDLRTMVDELGMVDLNPPDGAADTTEGQQVDKKADRVYLFQFPPVVPDLFDSSKMDLDAPTEADKQKDVNKVPAAGDSTSEEITATRKEASNKADDENKRPDHLPKLAVGKVGKLRVYKSGKATLDWGGTSLQLNMGVNPFFLQDSVMVKIDESATNPPAGEASGGAASSRQPNHVSGEAMAFGQIRGKFVVTPDWDEVLGKF